MNPEPSRPRIVHLALKVDDLERTKAFYRDVFGFTEVATKIWLRCAADSAKESEWLITPG